MRALLVLALLFSCVAAAPAPLTADETARVDTAVRKVLDATKATGAAIAVARDYQIVYAQGYGFTNAAETVPVTAQTQFEIGSVTKQFTAAAILQLVAAHKLKLDDTLSTLIPEYKKAARITVRQLLNQDSGLPEYTEGKDFVATASHSPGGFAPIFAAVKNKPLQFAPGTKWKYTNTNYIMLGRIIELRSHEPYDAYIRKHILIPAGMTHTATIAGEASANNFPTGYHTENGVMVASPSFGSGWAWAAGDLVSTVGDIVAWDRAFFGGQIISPKSVALATTALILPDGKPTNYGFGWVIDADNGHKRVWHNGGTFGFGSANVNYPAEHLTIVALINEADSPPQALATSIYGALHPQEAAAETVAAPGENPAITARAKEWLHRVQSGTIDRTQLDTALNALLTPELVASAKTQLGSLGEPVSMTYKGSTPDGHGNTNYTYRLAFTSISLTYYFGVSPAGKVTTLLLRP